MGKSKLRQILVGASAVSIGASLGLYLSGRREDGVFVGLWAPTFIQLAETLLAELED